MPSNPSVPPAGPDFVMWSQHVPFTKQGHPVFGNQGRDIRHVVVMETDHFKKLLALIPKETLDRVTFGHYTVEGA